MGGEPYRVALVHDARIFDGHYGIFLNNRTALADAPVRVAPYTCVDPSIEREYPNDGTRIYGWRIPLGEFAERGFNRSFPIFTRQLRRVPADVVHLADVFLASLLKYRQDVVLAIADLSKLTTRYFPRSSSRLHNRMLRFVPRAPALLALSEFTRQEIAQHLRYDPSRIFVQSAFSRLPPRPGPMPLEAAPPTPERPWTLLYTAVDRPGKNVAAFLRVLAATDARYRGLLVSRLTPGTEELVRSMGLAARLTVRRDVPDLTELYRRAHVLLFPSYYEGFGLPLVEAMSQGVPIIASDRTSVPEIVGDGGAVLPPDDTAAWVAALERLADPDRYRDASRRSFARGQTFTPARMRAALLAAYAVARRA